MLTERTGNDCASDFGYGPTLVCFSRRLRLSLIILLLTPSVALACPVCFGQSDSPMAHGINLGVLFLLGVVGFVLASFAAFFIYLARRARVAARLHAEDSLSCSNS